jgi:predicted outer membrane repeat protein
MLTLRGCEMKPATLAACVGFFVLASTAWAGTLYVLPDGSGDVPTIQAAVDSVAPGDTVLLGSGTYTGEGNYNIALHDKAFLMTSETGDPADCVIDCEGHLGSPRRAMDCQGGSARVIRGVTMRNANSAEGAVYCHGDLTIRDCVFESNFSGYRGGAVRFYGTLEASLKKCTFVSNQAAGEGGAVFIEGVMLLVTVDSCTFHSNQAEYGGAVYCYMHEAEAYIRNSVFVANSATVGGGIYVDDMYAEISNCTFHANDAEYGSGIVSSMTYSGVPSASVDNCIIAFGTGGGGYYQPFYGPDNNSLLCTNMFGNEGGDFADSMAVRLGVDGNFSVDPEFCEGYLEPYDLSLCSTSPCLPGNHPDGYPCGLIGALGQGCICDPIRTRPSTWGGIKALYR